MLISYVTTKLAEEYHHLTLWYFVSFIFGIVTYFAIACEPSPGQVAALAIFSLASLYLRRYGILYLFLSGLFISFTFGFGVAKYRAMNLKVTGLKEQITCSVFGTISSIKQTTRGTQIVLEDVLIKKHQHIRKVRINVNAEHSDALMVGDRIKIFAIL